MIAKFKTVALAGFATLALTGALTGAVPAIAQAQPAPAQPAPAQPAPPQQPPWHRHDIDRRIDRILLKIGATADQKVKIHAIADAAKADLAPMRAAMHDTRKQMHTLLSAPRIDAAAIETLRAQNTQTMDRISQRMTKALIDAANVLTPEQRAKLPALPIGRHPGPGDRE